MTIQAHPILAHVVEQYVAEAVETSFYGVPVAEMTRTELMATVCALSRTAAAQFQELLRRPPPLPIEGTN